VKDTSRLAPAAIGRAHRILLLVKFPLNSEPENRHSKSGIMLATVNRSAAWTVDVRIGHFLLLRPGEQTRAWRYKVLLSELRQLVDTDLVKVDLDDFVDHVRKRGRFEQSAREQRALYGKRDIRDDCDQSCVQFSLSHQLTKIACVVGDEHKFLAQNHLSELTILESRPSSPSHMIGLVARLGCDLREAHMQAFVDKKPHS